jgi:hypothetical protein
VTQHVAERGRQEARETEFFTCSFLPAVDDFTNDYLARGELDLTMPLIGPISGKLQVIDEYDNTPAPNPQPNSIMAPLG